MGDTSGRIDSSGVVFRIQRYSIQDGPGIRTTVVLKGCPLRCDWCANPESQALRPELLFRQSRCIGCGACVEACEAGALTLDDERVRLDRPFCDLCMKCADACSSGALEVSGEAMSVTDAVDEACRDEIFYRNSGGGVTLSGGEPLAQPKFAIALLKALKDRSIHTALDTCGHADAAVVDEAIRYTDLVLFDVKHINPEHHRDGTGVDNTLILDNLRRISASNRARIWIRIPVIPGYNDGEEHLRALTDVLGGIHAEKVSLLGWHDWGRQKYSFLGRDCPIEGLTPPDEARLDYLKGIMESTGLQVNVGY